MDRHEKQDEGRTAAKQAADEQAWPAAAGRPHTGPIIVGVDGTEHGLAAVAWAVREAALQRPGSTREDERRTVTLLHVFTVPAVPSAAGPLRLPEQRRTSQRHAASILERARQEALRTLDEVTAEPEPEIAVDRVDVAVQLVEGPVVRTLLELSRSATMLVLGSHSGSVFVHRLGSVVSACLHKAACPVVVVPGARRTGRRAAPGRQETTDVVVPL